MNEITLQLSFDSSIIDFVKKPDEIDFKMSLLSSGNSYQLEEIQDNENKNNLKSLRYNLLPWTWLLSNGDIDRPTHIRIWKITDNNIIGPFDIAINYTDPNLENPKNEDRIKDINSLKIFFESQVHEQITYAEDLKFKFENGSPTNIEVDENYEENSQNFGKAHSAIAQIAQKMFPFNEDLNLLNLSSNEIRKNETPELYEFLEGVFNYYDDVTDKDVQLVAFPCSTVPSSIWHIGNSKDLFEKDGFYTLQYPNRAIKQIEDGAEVEKILNVNIYTSATPFPRQITSPKGNVSLRSNGRYVGEVAISIEQDNDWKLHFNETLASLLDIRDSFIGFITPDEIHKDKNLTDNFVDALDPKERIDKVIQYFLNPFIHIHDYLDIILEVYNNNTIAASGIQDIKELETLRDKLVKKRNSIKANIDEIFKPELVDVLKLAEQYAKEKNAVDLHLKVPIDYETGSAASIKSAELLILLNQLNAISNESDFSAVFFTILLKIETFKDSKSISLDLANKSILAIKGEGINQVVTPVPIELPNNINLNSLWYSHILQNDKDANNVNLLAHLISKQKELKSFDFESISGEIIELHHTLPQTYANLPVFVSEAAKIGLNDFIIKRLKEKYRDIQPTNDQVPIRIQIGKSAEIVPAVKDDLSDELSGYVLLSTRGVKINDDKNFKDWKHHNWAKAKINIVTEVPTSILKKETIPLESPFLIPAYLPIENDTQKIFLEISNEKASLTAAIEGINQNVDELVNKASTNLCYYLDKKPDNNPYGLLYGYHYNFAAFAILNSGVIPEVLRHDSTILNKFKEAALGNFPIAGQKGYQYLRTKKIPSPGVKLHKVKVYPKQLNPLYFELFPEQPGNEDKRCNKLIIIGQGFNDGKPNNKFEITVEKPRTTFWDCYSFLHDGVKTVAENIKKHKLLNLKENGLSDDKRFVDYIDPAVSDYLHVEITDMHTLLGSDLITTKETLTYDGKAYDGKNEKLNLDKCSKVITVEFNPKANNTSINKTTSLITLKPGTIYSIKIYNLVEKKYFYLNKHLDCRFHECIDDFYDLGNAQLYNVDGVDYYKIAFDEHIIETAQVEPIEQNKITPEELWNDLKINDKLPSVANFNEKNQIQNESSIKAIIGGNSEKYKLYSRVDVQHQKWEWNGRQINIDVTQLMDPADPSKDLLNPLIKSDGIYTITEAMKFEAWAFSERPDYTATKTSARILASDENRDNIVHEYKNVIDNHCMYLRYTVQIFNRYELLGEPYKNSIKGEIPVEKAQPKNKTNPWKRHLKLSKREEALPTPAVRFYIPLTNSIEEANEVNDTADVMLVLDDVAYKEAGLAQKLALGIRKAKDPNSEDVYPEAGYDPTLSLIKTTPLKTNSEGDYVIIDDKYLKGPFGFTFDYNATNSKINSSSFIISGNGLTSYLPFDAKQKDPQDPLWPMFKLAVRNEIIPELHAKGIDGEKLNSELRKKINSELKNKLKSKWSSSQWVQFMKAVDSFVPTEWREEVRKTGSVNISDPYKEITFDLFNQFGATFWQYHNWYLIFSRVESNIGGLPIENYYNTFIVTDATMKIPSLSSVHLPNKEIKGFDEGYVRIMVVRQSDDYDIKKTNENVWEELFGKDDNKIKEDNTLAMPILSERIPIKTNFKKL